MEREISFLHESIYHLIAKISLPLIISSLVSMTVQLANTAFMGQVGTEEIYIRSLYTPFAFLIIALVEAFQISNQVSIARLKGEDKQEEIKKNIFTYLYIGIIVSLLLAIIMYLFSPDIADYYHVSADVFDTFVSFLRLVFLINVVGITTMVLTSSLRGVGKIGISMLLNIGYALLNVSLVYICSFNLEKGIIFILAVYILMSVFIFFLKDRITALMLTDNT